MLAPTLFLFFLLNALCEQKEKGEEKKKNNDKEKSGGQEPPLGACVVEEG